MGLCGSRGGGAGPRGRATAERGRCGGSRQLGRGGRGGASALARVGAVRRGVGSRGAAAAASFLLRCLGCAFVALGSRQRGGDGGPVAEVPRAERAGSPPRVLCRVPCWSEVDAAKARRAPACLLGPLGVCGAGERAGALALTWLPSSLWVFLRQGLANSLDRLAGLTLDPPASASYCGDYRRPPPRWRRQAARPCWLVSPLATRAAVGSAARPAAAPPESADRVATKCFSRQAPRLGHACGPTLWEAEAGGSKVPAQPGHFLDLLGVPVSKRKR
ncbi:PREDICTED: uncharacterized protein LOC106146593 [Chinchilla lanigera]|uniref:uncharacterized protein LOC106146593 n=1 Tax=Chinchilla lanigera TaxID=34839 RepID=UPI00069864B1|nr:PREDICTED: uncharacterized protein LOC106146593 [Chinchilla lanigera]